MMAFAERHARILPDHPDEPMRTRLQEASERVASFGVGLETVRTLRQRQETVFADIADYIAESSDHSTPDSRLPYGRIILPPRTGKTVIAGEVIARTGLTTTFVVPTVELVDQVVAEFRTNLPDALVGAFCSGREEVVPYGINVTTYAMMQSRMKSDLIPDAIKTSGIIFADEGHHAMTEKRLDFLQQSFDPDALRIALTATPDYNEKRRLATHFPYLIHELTLLEAMELDLLASSRAWMIEVDVDGSNVLLRSGDYDEGVLGRLMSAAPFFEALNAIRYAPENRNEQAMVICSSCQQAYDCLKYLTERRPSGSAKPALILGTTEQNHRRSILEHFRSGASIDTVISVRTLIEGFDAPRCKRLFDLAPSASLVNATQKFCRVLTPFENREARIYCFVPKALKVSPIFPSDVLLPLGGWYEAGTLIASRERMSADKSSKLTHPRVSPIAGVEVKSSVLMEVRVEKPKLDPKQYRQVRSVLASNSSFSFTRALSFVEFQELIFRHELFTGRGGHLLRYCGFAVRRSEYQQFLERFAPEAAANELLERHGEEKKLSCMEEAKQWFEREFDRSPRGPRELRRVLRAYGYGFVEPVRTPEELAIDSERLHVISAIADRSSRSHVELKVAYLNIGKEMNFAEIEKEIGFSISGCGYVKGHIPMWWKYQLGKVGFFDWGDLSRRFKALPVGLQGDDRYRFMASRAPYILPTFCDSSVATNWSGFCNFWKEIDAYGIQRYYKLVFQCLVLRYGRAFAVDIAKTRDGLRDLV